MKKYKVVQETSIAAYESRLNELAQAGWKVKSANIALDGGGLLKVYFALLENVTVEEELKQMLEEESGALDNIDLAPSTN